MNKGPFGVLAAFALIGAGTALAADTAPDARCVAECAALNADPDFCPRACTVNPRDFTRAEEPTDWRCMTACRERGGRYAQCKPNCVKR